MSDLQGLLREIRDFSLMIRIWKTSLKDFLGEGVRFVN